MIGYGNGEHAAHITAVSPEIVGNQITARAVPDTQWPEGLRQNQRVSARLVFESKKNVLKLPRGAFVESSGGRSAYVVDGSMASRRAITLGSVGASEVEIVSVLRCPNGELSERITRSPSRNPLTISTSDAPTDPSVMARREPCCRPTT